MTGPDDERPAKSQRADGTGSSDKQRHGAVAVVFACATPLAVLLLPTVPMLIATPILAAGALIAGIGARRAAKRTGGTAPGTITAIAIGTVGLCTALLMAPIIGPLARYESCLTSANTVQDERTCERALDRGLQAKLPFASLDLVNRLTRG
ncbi:MAG: hypothetical protein GEV07_08925 [Streptosporangiales bacterium]|nr:hypothetical protein [Streptosporangiales bacterium]